MSTPGRTSSITESSSAVETAATLLTPSNQRLARDWGRSRGLRGDEAGMAFWGQTKRREVEVELAGLEPATSWVRLARVGSVRVAPACPGDAG
jgi:hypothetical protein